MKIGFGTIASVTIKILMQKTFAKQNKLTFTLLNANAKANAA